MKKLLLIIIILIVLIYFTYRNANLSQERYGLTKDEYTKKFDNKDNRIFPFRYFTDVNNNVLPFVAVTGFFRDSNAKKMYYEYLKNGMNVFGITAYKTFPNNKIIGPEEGTYEKNDTFKYTKEIKNWLCCFRNNVDYGFSSYNNIVDISESDFYDAELDRPKVEKKYDFIYICNKDADHCPMDGWNAINRNFELAKKCFPVLCNQYKLKGLVVGRDGCNLDKEYPDKLEISGWLDWHQLQEKMREARILFVPNILDASPRVIAECITKDLAVLMNKNILCGFKYVTPETGEFFTNENDLSPAVQKLLSRINTISPMMWWDANYSQEKCQKRLHKFLINAFPQESSLANIDRVRFIL